MTRSTTILSLVLILSLSGCTDGQRTTGRRSTGQQPDKDALTLLHDADAPGSGRWQAPADWFDSTKSRRLEIARNDQGHMWYHGSPRAAERWQGTDDGYRLEAATGTLDLLVSENDGDKRSGTYAVTLRDDLATRYPRISGTLSPEKSLLLILEGIDDEYLATLTADGHKVTWPQVARLRLARVSAQYVVAIRKARATPAVSSQPVPPDPDLATPLPEPGPMPVFSADEIVYLSQRRVPIEYIQQLQEAGYRFNSEQLYYLHSRRITTEFAAAMRDLGYDLSHERLYYLHSRRLTAEFARTWQQIGYDLSPADLYYAKSYRLDIEDAQAMREAGYDLDLKEVYYLQSRRVSTDFATRLRAAGYDFSIKELYYLSSRRVPLEFALAVLSPDHEPFTAEQLYKLHSSRVDADFINALREQR